MDTADRAQEAEAQQRDDALKAKKRGKPRTKMCYRCGIKSLDVNTDNLCPDCAERVKTGADAPMPGPKVVEETEECSRCHNEEAKDRERKKTQALSDYNKLLGDVEDLQEMTDTRAFKEFVRRCRKKIEESKERLLTADKAGEIAHCQEAVKVLKAALDEFRDPVDQLAKYISDMPLFAPEFTSRAQWMPDLFSVDIRKS